MLQINSINADLFSLIRKSAELDEKLLELEKNSDKDSSIESFINNSFFTKDGYYNKSGVYTTDKRFKCTDLIKLEPNSIIYIYNSQKSNSFGNFVLFNETEQFIKSVDINSSIAWYIYDNSTENANYIGINSYKDSQPILIIDKVIPLKILSKSSITHNWVNKKFVSFGDSKVAAGRWQKVVANMLNCNSVVRGIGSSGLEIKMINCAVSPDGTFIDRRAIYDSDESFEQALSSKGYTNKVTSPTWIEYSNSPSSYTLEDGSYFLINSNPTSDERINTIPIDADIVSVGFGTNDTNFSEIGNIEDFGGETYIGKYRLMLSKINKRATNADIILVVPECWVSEYENNSLTENGIKANQIRKAIKEIAETYHFNLIDFSKVINYVNMSILIADGIHPNTNGYNKEGSYYARNASLITIGQNGYTEFFTAQLRQFITE